MKVVNKILGGITNLLSVCSTAMVTAMMLLIVVDVFMRTFFNKPIAGSTEITQMLMAGMLLGFAKSCLGNDNLKVDVAVERLPRKVQCVIDIFTSIICIGVSVLLSWRIWVNAMYHMKKGITYLTLASVPKWPFIVILAVGLAGGVAGLLMRIIKLGKEIKAPETEAEGGEQ